MEHDRIAKKKSERAKKDRGRELNDLRTVLASAEGRRVIWRLMSHAGVFRGSFTGNSETFFNEGKRDIGLLILKDSMEAKPDSFAQMQREHASEARIRQLEIEKEEKELKED